MTHRGRSIVQTAVSSLREKQDEQKKEKADLESRIIGLLEPVNKSVASLLRTRSDPAPYLFLWYDREIREDNPLMLSGIEPKYLQEIGSKINATNGITNSMFTPEESRLVNELTNLLNAPANTEKTMKYLRKLEREMSALHERLVFAENRPDDSYYQLFEWALTSESPSEKLKPTQVRNPERPGEKLNVYAKTLDLIRLRMEIDSTPMIQALAKLYMPLVANVMRRLNVINKTLRWENNGSERDINDFNDIYQIGVLGLLHAAHNYNPEKVRSGISPEAFFNSYARTRITGAIIDYLRKTSVLNRSDMALLVESLKAEDRFHQRADGSEEDRRIISLYISQGKGEIDDAVRAANEIWQIKQVGNPFSLDYELEARVKSAGIPMPSVFEDPLDNIERERTQEEVSRILESDDFFNTQSRLVFEFRNARTFEEFQEKLKQFLPEKHYNYSSLRYAEHAYRAGTENEKKIAVAKILDRNPLHIDDYLKDPASLESQLYRAADFNELTAILARRNEGLVRDYEVVKEIEDFYKRGEEEKLMRESNQDKYVWTVRDFYLDYGLLGKLLGVGTTRISQVLKKTAKRIGIQAMKYELDPRIVCKVIADEGISLSGDKTRVLGNSRPAYSGKEK